MVIRVMVPLIVLLSALSAHSQPVPVIEPPRNPGNVTVSVGDFLADANGAPVSPYRAFKAAIESARTQNAARLIVPPGRYVFNDPEIATLYAHIYLIGVQDLEFDGQGAELIFTNHIARGIVLADSQRVVVRNFSIEYAGTVASPGVVKKQPDGRTAIRIHDDFPAGPSTAFGAVSEFDVAARRWKKTRNEVYDVTDAVMIGPQTFVAPRFSYFSDGTEVIVRHRVYGANAVVGNFPTLKDVALEDITVYSAPGMGFHFAATGKGIRLTRCVIARKGDQLISTTADGAHFSGTAGHILVEDSDFSGQGDDGINIGALWLEVAAQADPLTLDVRYIYNNRFYPGGLAAGMELVFRHRSSQAEYGRRRVVNVREDAVKRQYRVVLDQPIQVEGESLIDLVEMGSSVYLVRNNRFHDHRGRGLSIAAAHGRVENNLVRDSTMACINLATDAVTFFEGFGVRDLVISGNRFEGCNYSGGMTRDGQKLAAINIMGQVATGLTGAAVHSDLVIEQNRIVDTPGLAILVASAREVTMRGNVVVDSGTGAFTDMPMPPAAPCSIFVAHASGVTISTLTHQEMGKTSLGTFCADPRTTSNVTSGGRRRRAVGSG